MIPEAQIALVRERKIKPTKQKTCYSTIYWKTKYSTCQSAELLIAKQYQEKFTTSNVQAENQTISTINNQGNMELQKRKVSRNQIQSHGRLQFKCQNLQLQL